MPTFLYGYEPFAELEKWRHEEPNQVEHHRRWMIEVNEVKMFACELIWFDYHSNRKVYITQYGQGLHEAVYEALRAFKKNQKTIDDPNGSPR